tara:strand:- start:9262 stop:10311 length:1050 start_codon:yes stop_codon:yes gene_type:complete
MNRFYLAVFFAVPLIGCTSESPNTGTVSADLVSGSAEESLASNCAGVGELSFICDLVGPEDLALVPGSEWVVASGNQEGGRLHVVNVREKTTEIIFPSPSSREDYDAVAFPNCPGPIDPNEGDEFRAHGLYLDPGDADIHTLYVVHHGFRESIEVFHLDVSTEQPFLVWIGCAEAPEGSGLNAVVALPGGGFATTAPRIEGEVDSGVWEWHGDSGWSIVPGSENIRPNGLEISPDGSWFYVAGWQDERFVRLSRGQDSVISDAVQLGFRPDNLRFASDGLIYATGHTDFREPTEASNVAWVDPDTLEFERIFQQPYLDGFAAATTALVVREEIWLGTNRGGMIGYFPKP